MSISLFAGCSYTAGIGFDLLKSEPNLWVNLLHANNNLLKNTTLLNISVGGRSNAGIFQDVIDALLTHNDIQYVFVNWTSMPRYEMSVGLELYPTRQVFIPGTKLINHNLNDKTYTVKYLTKINDRFTSLANEHYEIINLVHYTNLIVKLCEIKNCQVFFINSLCPWDDKYFTKINNVLHIYYTTFTKDLLPVNSRDDEEIFKLYNMVHNDYDTVGGIHEDLWLNLYTSMRSMLVDTNNDGMHPGPTSNHIYYRHFSKSLESVLQ